MINLYYWTTPNGHKITIFLEETDLPYTIHPIDISKGEQFDPEFLKISPNNRIPAIVDTEPKTGSSISVFESGAILQYLAEKTGQFLPISLPERVEVLQWLNWQMGGLGPMLGQNHHFAIYATEKIPYAIERYVNETARLYGVLNQRLSEPLEEGLCQREYIAGSYSITDMACYPWITGYERQSQDLADFPHVKRWFEAIQARPAVQRAYQAAEAINP